MQQGVEKVRIDKYLWAIRIFKTRRLAADACDAGRVKLDGKSVKASRNVQPGDRYEIKASERNWSIEVTGLLAQRKAYSEAVLYYKDHTPVEEQSGRPKEQAPSFYTGKRLSKIGRPTKKDRRDLEDFME